MRVIAAFFGPYAPDALTAHVSVFSHDFKGFERLTKLATSSLSAGQASLPLYPFRSIRLCYGTRADFTWRTRIRRRAPSNSIWGIATSNTPYGIQNSRHSGF